MCVCVCVRARVCVCVLCLRIAIKSLRDVNLIHCTLARSLRVLHQWLAEEIANISSVPDEEDWEDPFLRFDELEEDETVIDDD